MEEGEFDVVIIGTGLAESIAAAALAKAGFKVAHLDQNPYYGADEACLSVDELIQWGSTLPSTSQYSSFSHSGTVAASRQYSLSLSPSVIPSLGPLISSLVSSGVSRYGGFRLIERVGIYDSSGNVRSVPGSKEDVFKDKNFSLVDKRRLMRFLMFASGDFETKKEIEGKEDVPFAEFLKNVFSLTEDMITAITYALSYCFTPKEPTLTVLHRLRRYLKASGRYGSSPFLIGQYGGSGEMAQGFCRSAAVSGAVYILGRNITSISHIPPEGANSQIYSFTLDDFPEPVSSKLIISSLAHIPSSLASGITLIPQPPAFDDSYKDSVAVYGIAIIDQPLSFSSIPDTSSDDDGEAAPENPPPAMDTGILVFPPSSVPYGLDTAVTVLVIGENTMSTPKGKWIVHISGILPSTENSPDAEKILKPYLHAALSLRASEAEPVPLEPLFTAFYVKKPAATATATSQPPQQPRIIVLPPLPPLPLPDTPDASAANAEVVFWEAVRILRPDNESRAGEGGVDTIQDGGEAVERIASFWPPLELIDGDDDD